MLKIIILSFVSTSLLSSTPWSQLSLEEQATALQKKATFLRAVCRCAQQKHSSKHWAAIHPQLQGIISKTTEDVRQGTQTFHTSLKQTRPSLKLPDPELGEDDQMYKRLRKHIHAHANHKKPLPLPVFPDNVCFPLNYKMVDGWGTVQQIALPIYIVDHDSEDLSPPAKSKAIFESAADSRISADCPLASVQRAKNTAESGAQYVWAIIRLQSSFPCFRSQDPPLFFVITKTKKENMPNEKAAVLFKDAKQDIEEIVASLLTQSNPAAPISSPDAHNTAATPLHVEETPL